MRRSDDYVLVTRVEWPDRPRPQVHVYGPWTRAEARRHQRQLMRDAEEFGYLDRLSSNVCKVLTVDPDPEILR